MVKKFWNEVSEEYEYMSMGFMFDAEEGDRRPTRFDALKSVVRHRLVELVCRWRGHDIVETGYAGPDSGCMDHECVRCGRSWRTVLY